MVFIGTLSLRVVQSAAHSANRQKPVGVSLSVIPAEVGMTEHLVSAFMLSARPMDNSE
jgi:hypothetical protein